MSPLDSIDALKEWPIKVSYPKAGDLYLLLWWTDYVRGHACVAESEDRIEQILREVYVKEGPSVKLKEYWRVSVVSPPLELRQTYARGRLLEDVDNFRWFVGYLFQNAQAKDHPVKKTATRCKNYKARYESEADSDKEHTMCLNCFKGWLPKGETVESLYLRRRLEPRHVDPYAGRFKPDPRKRTGYPVFKESVAPEADISQPLYALAQHFGDHSDGLRIDEIKKDDEGEWPWGQHFHCPPISFFFQGTRTPTMPKHFVALSKTAIADAKKAEADKIKERKAELEKERLDANERLRRLLEP